MSVLKIKRVAVMPAEAEANTTYLIAVAGGNDLQVAVTNGDGTVVKKSLLRTDIAGMISAAIALSETGSSADLVTQSVATLADAKAYTDTKVGTEAIDRVAGDAAALASSKTYTDNAITAEVTRSNTYADNAVATGIAALDLSATVQYADNIAGRDIIAADLTKSSLIFVVDATGDATVTVGSALYFYNVPNATFTKVAEYESLDLIIPNKTILEGFSVVQSRLHFDGVMIATVDFDAAGSTW